MFGCLSSQRYNFLKANHNKAPSVSSGVALFIKSKIQFSESKSQRKFNDKGEIESCLSSQRYNFLKANHNYVNRWKLSVSVVYQVKDTIFWKQITTHPLVSSSRSSCLSSQRYNFLKANHNPTFSGSQYFWLFIKSKIQFSESKSQPFEDNLTNNLRCLSSQRYNFLKANHNDTNTRKYALLVVYQVKDTIFWKQITTHLYSSLDPGMLFIKSKIQFSESKSQRNKISLVCQSSCLSSQRYNFLKANHNILSVWAWTVLVVYQVKDTIFWKQITTQLQPNNQNNSCLSSQRYNFLKANHN